MPFACICINSHGITYAVTEKPPSGHIVRRLTIQDSQKKCHNSVSYKTNANFCATFFLPLLRSIGDTMSKYHIYFVWLAFESGHCDVEIDTTEWLKLLYLICDEIKFSLLLQKLKCGTVIKNVLKTKAPNWEMSLCYVW